MGEMISEGRIPLNEAETAKADEILAGQSGSLTRDHEGRLIVEIDGVAHIVAEDGTVTDG